MDSDKQWRIDTGLRLKGALLQRRTYEAPSEDWDHGHCACCWATFADFDGADIQHGGYTTTDACEHGAGYDWVCDQCFSELKDDMEWRVALFGEDKED